MDPIISTGPGDMAAMPAVASDLIRDSDTAGFMADVIGPKITPCNAR